MNLKRLIGGLALSFVALSTSALEIQLVGGGSQPLPGDWDDFNGGAAPNVGNTISTFTAGEAGLGEGVYVDEEVFVTYEYLGSEAGNNNTTSTPVLADFFDNATSGVGDLTGPVWNAAGALNFAFNTDGKFTGGVLGAGSFQNAVGASPIDLLLGVFVESATSVILMFGDGASDTDFDDMFVRATVTAVPVPAALPLFAAALAAFGYFRRRRNAI